MNPQQFCICAFSLFSDKLQNSINTLLHFVVHRREKKHLKVYSVKLLQKAVLNKYLQSTVPPEDNLTALGMWCTALQTDTYSTLYMSQ